MAVLAACGRATAPSTGAATPTATPTATPSTGPSESPISIPSGELYRLTVEVWTNSTATVTVKDASGLVRGVTGIPIKASPRLTEPEFRIFDLKEIVALRGAS